MYMYFIDKKIALCITYYSSFAQTFIQSRNINFSLKSYLNIFVKNIILAEKICIIYQ